MREKLSNPHQEFCILRNMREIELTEVKVIRIHDSDVDDKDGGSDDSNDNECNND